MPASPGLTPVLRWGVVSTARINDAFLAGVAGSPGNRVVAVASRDGDRARAYADAHDIPSAHAGYESLLDDEDVDAVYVSLPNSLHLPWTEAALRAGKHVLCEKPLGRDPEAVAAAFDLADERGLVLSEAFMYRHHPQTRALSELVGSGAIGRLRVIRSSFSFLLGDRSDVRLSAELDGGALMDLGCYCVSASRLLAGEPVAAAGVQVVGDGGVDESFCGALRFADDVVAHFDATFLGAPAGRLEVCGDAGTLVVEDPWHIRTPGVEVVTAEGTRRIEIPAADSYRLEAEDVAAAVSGGARPLLGRADAVGQARAIAALYAAAV